MIDKLKTKTEACKTASVAPIPEQIQSGYYLYPEAKSSGDLKLRMNSGSTYEANVRPRTDVSVIKHGLKIPMDAQDYSDFATKMKAHEQEFLNVFSA